MFDTSATQVATSAQSATAAITVRVQPAGLTDWQPTAGQLLTLIAYYEPGVTAVGPSGWTLASEEPVAVWNFREVKASFWWLLLDRDYDGWRTDGGPRMGLDLYELPAVHFDRPNIVDLEFKVYEGVELSEVTAPDGTRHD